MDIFISSINLSDTILTYNFYKVVTRVKTHELSLQYVYYLYINKLTHNTLTSLIYNWTACEIQIEADEGCKELPSWRSLISIGEAPKVGGASLDLD
tara:strand:- start:975 stop:1262 length:288 start_codon:yes stop_codon:yes gene_type:complete